jgi:hypothetical protein
MCARIPGTPTRRGSASCVCARCGSAKGTTIGAIAVRQRIFLAVPDGDTFALRLPAPLHSSSCSRAAPTLNVGAAVPTSNRGSSCLRAGSFRMRRFDPESAAGPCAAVRVWSRYARRPASGAGRPRRWVVAPSLSLRCSRGEEKGCHRELALRVSRPSQQSCHREPAQRAWRSGSTWQRPSPSLRKLKGECPMPDVQGLVSRSTLDVPFWTLDVQPVPRGRSVLSAYGC